MAILDVAQREQLAVLLRMCPDAAISYRFTWHLLRTLRKHTPGELGQWLDEARGSGLPELESFAEGPHRNYVAVRAALSLPSGFQASCPNCPFPASAESLPTAPSGP